MWGLGSTAVTPDSQPILEYMYGPAAGSANLARFKLPAFDAIYERMLTMPDSPERASLFIEASKLVAAYMPYKIQTHRIYIQLNHPWIIGFRQSRFRHEIWQYIEVDTALRERLIGA
jgi:ABC-type transport system substrate-binding protein